jgi:hypothetical protein
MYCIHPSTPFINRKPTKDNKITANTKKIVEEFKTKIKLIDGNKIFENAEFFTPLSITQVQKIKDPNIEIIYSHIDEDNDTIHVYKKLDSVFMHGNDIVLDIKKKIESKNLPSFEDKLYRNGSIGENYYALCRYSGHPPKKGQKNVNPDFFQLVYKKNEQNFEELILNRAREKSEQKGGNQFNDIVVIPNQINNFHNFLLTKFARFAVSIYKISGTLDCKELDLVPYMDFSQEWSDETLFEFFEFTNDEIQFINDYIPNWYGKDFE